ncbi:TetR/AcrR family transcriptional regulator [Bacillus dakarensis]|uniref:TetR/AcrR family transcriptional regulator n=1 Tax=Robertmurraya dakarensis TaxID=1926278 RepID=UPI000981FA42|nr:TetR/AcrR family transcriptional regulator [Bacillus dakarensis]
MTDKRLMILEQAMILFATKGYHSTSMQEVAEQAGVSKGGLYSYFSSKNELLIEIYRYYYQSIREQMNHYENMKLSDPRERLQLQLKVYIEGLLSRKEFILMHLRENVNHSAELGDFLTAIYIETFEWYERTFKDIYGERIAPYTTNLVIIFSGMIESYLKTLFVSTADHDIGDLTTFLISRLDDLAEGMIAKKESLPIPPLQFVTDPMHCRDSSLKDQLQGLLDKIEKLVGHAKLDKDTKKDCMDSVEFLKEEAKQERPKRVVFQGLLNFLEVIPETKPVSDKIMKLLD